MIWPSLAPKWPILVPFCEMNHPKSNFSLISDTLSVLACWGQNMLLFKILVDETQTPQSQDFKSTFKQILVCIFLSVRDNLENTFHCETPCSTFILKYMKWCWISCLFSNYCCQIITHDQATGIFHIQMKYPQRALTYENQRKCKRPRLLLGNLLLSTKQEQYSFGGWHLARYRCLKFSLYVLQLTSQNLQVVSLY